MRADLSEPRKFMANSSLEIPHRVGISLAAIVINYFGVALTTQCAQSLIGEKLDTLLLVDNSASPEQREAMLGLAANISATTPDLVVRTILNNRNLGFGAAVNRAIAADQTATGGHDYYLLINNDAVATKGLVAALLAAARGNPKAALISPRIDWAGQDVSYYWYQPYLALVTRNQLPGSFPYLSGCCLLVDAALLVDGPLFDEDFFMYGEDVELSARATRSGKVLGTAPNSLVIHAGTGSSSQRSAFYEYHVAKGHFLLARKLGRTWLQRVVMQACQLPLLVARALVRALRHSSMAPILALARAARETIYLKPASQLPTGKS